MPILTRRRSPHAREKHIFYGDVRVGTIARRIGVPPDKPRWGWSCGFHPGSHPGKGTGGAAATFNQAKADFETARRKFLAKRTEPDFQAWRDPQEWTERNYATRKTASGYTSTALEILGFTGAEAREGLAAHLEKRKPMFPQDCPI